MRCKNCGEHWDLDSAHEAVSERFPEKPWMDEIQSSDAPHRHSDGKYHNQGKYEKFLAIVMADFRIRGCVAFGGDECEKTETTENRQLNLIIQDELHHDIDAMVSSFEDAEMMGLFD